ncbi:MAG: hypothetical protein ABFS17_09800 [Chloroflexota bacterium]
MSFKDKFDYDHRHPRGIRGVQSRQEDDIEFHWDQARHELNHTAADEHLVWLTEQLELS